MMARLRIWAVMLAVPVGAIVLWWVASEGSTSPFFPPLSRIMETFVETWVSENFYSDVVPSLYRMFTGYVLGVGFGIAFGMLLGRIRPLYQALSPMVHFARSVPATALVPVGITLLGIGDAPKIYLIAFVSIFPVLLNTIDGVRSVEPGLEDVARSFRLTRRQRVLSVQLPAAAPPIFAGMRISLGLAFIMMIVSEMVAATSGLGFMTLTAQQSFRIAQMWSGMILLGVLGAGLNLLFVQLERWVLRWHYDASART